MLDQQKKSLHFYDLATVTMSDAIKIKLLLWGNQSASEFEELVDIEKGLL